MNAVTRKATMPVHGGVQLSFPGFAGANPGRIHDELRARPLCVVRAVLEAR